MNTSQTTTGTDVYPSATSKLMCSLIIFVFVITIAIGILVPSWFMIGFSIFPAIFVIVIILRIRYTIIGNTLRVFNGLKSTDYPIDSIVTVKKIWSILSAPAASPHRIAICFNSPKHTKSALPLEISPKDREAFIHSILKINPNIKILTSKE